jgi:hypothetical protein
MKHIKIQPYCFVELKSKKKTTLMQALQEAHGFVDENKIDLAELEHRGKVYPIKKKV